MGSGRDRRPRGVQFVQVAAIVVAFMTTVLILIGALVTSNEAGDSVPDWPLSFGRWLIDSNFFVANVRYEYSHRFVAGVVAILTFVLAAVASFGDPRRWMKRLAWVVFIGVIAQAAIGGVRVLFPSYKPFIAVPHALVAQSFFAAIVSIAVFSSKGWWNRTAERIDAGALSLRATGPLLIAAILTQLVLGAGFRHQAFGIIPHVFGAIVVLFLVMLVSITTLLNFKDSYLRRPAGLLLGLVVIQIGLGIAAYMARLAAADDPQPLEPMISLTVAHVVTGALILAAAVTLTLRGYQTLGPASERAGEVTPANLASSPGGATV